MEWDNKFGVMEHHHEFDDLEKKIEGVGRDAEIVTNSRGGKQSKSPMALHLVDPNFLSYWAKNQAEALEYLDEGDSLVVDEDDTCKYNCYRAIEHIADCMIQGDTYFLMFALDDIEVDEVKQLTRIAKVLQVGASRYAPNNWRLIPQEEHINHALIHIIAHLMGDRQDEHLDHALCRLMMAYATEKSEGFDYGKYVRTNDN